MKRKPYQRATLRWYLTTSASGSSSIMVIEKFSTTLLTVYALGKIDTRKFQMNIKSIINTTKEIKN